MKNSSYTCSRFYKYVKFNPHNFSFLWSVLKLNSNMKFLIVLFALIVAAFTAPQFMPILQPLTSQPNIGVAASREAFNPYGGFGHPGFGGVMSGSTSNAAAGT